MFIALPPVQKLARLGCAAVVSLIIFLDLFGRRIEKAFPVVVELIVPLAAVCIALLLSGTLRLRRARPPLGEALVLGALTGGTLIAAALFCEALITLPIERIHMLKYLLLGVFAFFSGVTPGLRTQTLRAAAFCFAVGTIDECFQYFIPNRVFAFEDMVLNWGGAFFGLALGRLLLKWSRLLRPAAI